MFRHINYACIINPTAIKKTSTAKSEGGALYSIENCSVQSAVGT